MPANIVDIRFETGGVVLVYEAGPNKKIDWITILQAADIPTGLTHVQVDGIRLLANLTVIILRTLINREMLDGFGTELGDDDSAWDWDAVIYALEQLGGDFGDPDIDNVEDA